MEKVTFMPNVPVLVSLKFPDGKLSEGRFGDQMFYTLTDGRGMYLNCDVAEKINGLEIRAREPFYICKRHSGKKGDSPQWDIWRPDAAELPRQREVTTPAAVVPAVSSPQVVDHSIVANGNGYVNGHANGHGGNGNRANGTSGNDPNGAPKSYAAAGIPEPATKIPFDEAFIEVVQIVQNGLQETGEQWSDQARQDAVSTILIAATREGWIAPWRRTRRNQ